MQQDMLCCTIIYYLMIEGSSPFELVLMRLHDFCIKKSLLEAALKIKTDREVLISRCDVDKCEKKRSVDARNPENVLIALRVELSSDE